MKLAIDIRKDTPCEIILTDCSPYLFEEDGDIDVFDLFKVSHRVGIDVVLWNKLDGTLTIEYAVSEDLTPIKIQVEFDGWGTIQHIVIPNKKWFDLQMSKANSVLSYYDTVYYYDDHKFYKYKNQLTTEVTIDELIEINPVYTTISKVCKDFVSVCLLTQCYLNLCKLLFENGIGPNCCGKSGNQDLIYKRDMVWMTLNVIEYLVEFGEFEEAERILENVGGCNGLCLQELKKSKGCGCRS